MSEFSKIQKSDIPTLIAVVSSTLVGTGLLGGYLFYDNFGINIFNFIDLSEAILLFFNYTFYLISSFLLGASVTYIYPVERKLTKRIATPKTPAKILFLRALVVFTILGLFFHSPIIKSDWHFYISVGIKGLCLYF